MFDITLIPDLSIQATQNESTEYVKSRLRPRVNGKVVTKAEQLQNEWYKRLRPRDAEGKVLKPLSKNEICEEIFNTTGISREKQNSIFFALKLLMEIHDQESIDLDKISPSSKKKSQSLR